jgi:hypothetical protein
MAFHQNAPPNFTANEFQIPTFIDCISKLIIPTKPSDTSPAFLSSSSNSSLPKKSLELRFYNDLNFKTVLAYFHSQQNSFFKHVLSEKNCLPV